MFLNDFAKKLSFSQIFRFPHFRFRVLVTTSFYDFLHFMQTFAVSNVIELKINRIVMSIANAFWLE